MIYLYFTFILSGILMKRKPFLKIKENIKLLDFVIVLFLGTISIILIECYGIIIKYYYFLMIIFIYFIIRDIIRFRKRSK